MPVETIECQIVQAQLGRYLSGEAFTNEALSQIEDHIASCDLCRQEVAVRRATLQSLLGPSTAAASAPDALLTALRETQAASTMTIPTHAVVEQAVPESASLSPSQKTLSKPLMYGAALAVVLVAMSYIGKNPTSVFGDRATTVASTVATPPVTGVDLAPAPTPEPLSLDEWTTLGLDAFLPYDSADAPTFEPWQWLSVSESLPEEPIEPDQLPIEPTSTEPVTAQQPTQNTPGAAVVKDPVSTPAARPAETKPKDPKERSKPKAVAPESKAPRNVIKVYAPGQ